jgi:hypothetical protein
MIAVHLLAFAQTLLLHDTGLARAEPKACATGCGTSSPAHPRTTRIDQRWPWATQLATAFARVAALPVPHD